MNLIKYEHHKEELLQHFAYDNSLGIYLKDEFIQQEYYYQYANDFDYNDGEEGTNGNIYFFNEDLQLVATKTIYAGDSEDYEFTELGVSLLKKELVDYCYWLLNTI